MAKKLDTDLAAAQADLATYGEEDELAKALGIPAAPLSKGKGGDAPAAAPAAEDGDGADEYDEDEDDEDEDEDDEDDEDDKGKGGSQDYRSKGDAGDKGDDKGKQPMPDNLKRSRSTADEASDELLKSLLLDQAGQPKPIAEVIEVSEVLTDFADTIAKGHGAVVGELGTVQAQIDTLTSLVKSLGRVVLKQSSTMQTLAGELGIINKSAGVTQPMSGLSLSLRKPMPAGDGAQPKGDASRLTKSMVATGLQVAYQSSMIDIETFRAASGTLDSRGVESALGLIPAALAEQFRKLGE